MIKKGKLIEISGCDIEIQPIHEILKKNIFFGVVSGFNCEMNTGKLIFAVNDYSKYDSMKLNSIRGSLSYKFNHPKNNIVERLAISQEYDIKSFITNSLRSDPDIISLPYINNNNLNDINLVSMTGHTCILTSSKNNVEDVFNSFIEDELNLLDLIHVIDFIYTSMTCIKDDELNYIAIEEYIVFDKKTKEKIIESNKSEYIDIIRNKMKEDNSRYIDNLEIKYKEKQISEKSYKIYKENLKY